MNSEDKLIGSGQKDNLVWNYLLEYLVTRSPQAHPTQKHFVEISNGDFY